MRLSKFVSTLLSALFLAAPAFAASDLTAPEALAAAESGKVRLIDIRTQREWRETGIAPGAGRVDMYQGAAAFIKGIEAATGGDKNAPIALICRTGNRTTQAQKFLQSQGYTQVYNVKEGMAGSTAGPGWLKRGLPVDACRNC